MRKLLISLMFVLSTSLAFGQKYQGDINLNLQILGLSASTSHGVFFNNHYIGIGAQVSETALVFVDRSWVSAYADYRHLFNVGIHGNSIFVQLAPGFANTSTDKVLNMIFGTKNKDGGKKIESVNCFYAKIGSGYQWNWTKTGLSLGVYCEYFADNTLHSAQHFYPSFGLTFHW